MHKVLIGGILTEIGYRSFLIDGLLNRLNDI